MYENVKYILITSAKNEVQFIENTINCILEQSIKPVQWLIVSDASTDGTDEIIKKYAAQYSFIKYIRKEKDDSRNFASKVFALNTAIKHIDFTDYDFIGILDADITFTNDYYEKIIIEFERNVNLGLAGGEFYDIIDKKRIKVNKSPNSVRGGIQLFRKKCFDEIGKFTPLENGGEDIVMEVMVRKNGWKVKSFDHLWLEHHRLTGTGGRNIWKSKFKEGIIAYYVGYHPIFQIIKSIYRFKERPFILGGLLTILGFTWTSIKAPNKMVPQDFIDFLRHEQLRRIKGFNIY